MRQNSRISAAGRDYGVEQLNTATELVARRTLFVFVETSSLDECGEAFDIGLLLSRGHPRSGMF